MSIKSNFVFDFDNKNNFFYKLLSEEDFDFKTKNIKFDIRHDNALNVSISCNSILDLKIATTALIKSLEVIEKTLEV